MTDQQHILDEIDRLKLEIYPGPWVANDLGIGYEITTQQQMPINSGIKDTFPRSDAEFIALARTALPQLASVVTEILAFVEFAEKLHTENDEFDLAGRSFILRIKEAINNGMEDEDD